MDSSPGLDIPKWRPVSVVLATASPDVSSRIKEQLASEDGTGLSKFTHYWTKEAKTTLLYCCGRRRYGCFYEVKVVEKISADGSADGVEVFEKGSHMHATQKDDLSGVPPHQKSKIAEALKERKRPREIYKEIVNDSPATKTTLAQVQRATNRLRKKLCSELNYDTVGDLYAFLTQHELSGESDEHKVGFLKGWKCFTRNREVDKPSEVIFAVTTKRLLFQLVQQNEGQLVAFVEADATYKLLQNSYPCLVFGTVDSLHSFRTVCLVVSKTEDWEAFAHGLNSIKSALQEFFTYNWEPAYAMADSARAIHKAFTKTFPDIVVGKCFFIANRA
jgi:hypothetical protein